MVRLIRTALLTSLFLVCLGEASSVMPLSYFKNSGLYASMANSSSFVNRYFTDYNIDEMRPDARLYTGGELRLKHLGSESASSIERSSLVTNVAHAGCDPYDQIVPIPNDQANVLMYPSCILLKQCGGCCGHPSLSCKPSSTTTKSVQIMKYVYDGSTAHPAEKIDYVEVQEHTACECQCKLTAEECQPQLHTFDEWECKCKCKNRRTSCATNMRWDETLCSCRCSSVQNCGTGYRYNMATCACEEVQERTGSNNGGQGQANSGENAPATPPNAVTEGNPCNHLTCPRRYKAAVSGAGRCICRFDRSRSG